jgi:hypothetical protein
MNLLRTVVNGVTDENIWTRIAWMYITFFLLLIPVTVSSFFLLPEGILRGKHPLIGFELAPLLWVSTLQVFGYYLMFTILIMGANLFAGQSRRSPKRFIPTGCLAFRGVAVTAGLYLGTWCQEIITPPPPLFNRFIRLFDIFHHTALWELSGYLSATTTSSSFTLIFTNGKRVLTRKKWQDVTLTKIEKFLFALSFVLLICGAFIETYGITQLSGH